MAYVGLRKPIIAEITGAKVYGEPFAFGKAIGLQVTPNYAEGSLNADDAQVEYDKEFNYAEVTLNTSTIPIEAHEKMFGHKVNEGKTGATFNKDDQAKYVGMILSILVDTFISKISLTMQPGPKIDSISGA